VKMNDYQFQTIVRINTVPGKHSVSTYGPQSCGSFTALRQGSPCTSSTSLGPLSFDVISDPSKFTVDLSPAQIKEIDSFWEEIKNHNKSQNYEQMIQTANEILEINPYDVDAINEIGFVNYKLGRFSDAISNYKKALFLDPTYTDSMINLGIVYAVQGNYAEAHSLFKDVLKIEPKNTYAMFNQALAYTGQDNLSAANHEFEKLIGIDEQFYDAYLELAINNNDMKNYDTALLWANDLLSKEKDNIEAFFVKGQILAQMDQHEEAIARYDKALLIEPNDNQILSMKQLSLDEMSILNQLGTENLIIIGIGVIIAGIVGAIIKRNKRKKTYAQSVTKKITADFKDQEWEGI